MESALSLKDQATRPKAIREHLLLGPGDRVKFFVHPGWKCGDFAEGAGFGVEGDGSCSETAGLD
jgi:hypothetical protein